MHVVLDCVTFLIISTEISRMKVIMSVVRVDQVYKRLKLSESTIRQFLTG